MTNQIANEVVAPSPDLVAQAADLIINTRDFCGDERLAVMEFAHENRFRDWRALWDLAIVQANVIWRRDEIAAKTR